MLKKETKKTKIWAVLKSRGGWQERRSRKRDAERDIASCCTNRLEKGVVVAS